MLYCIVNNWRKVVSVFSVCVWGGGGGESTIKTRTASFLQYRLVRRWELSASVKTVTRRASERLQDSHFRRCSIFERPTRRRDQGSDLRRLRSALWWWPRLPVKPRSWRHQKPFIAMNSFHPPLKLRLHPCYQCDTLSYGEAHSL